MLWYTWVSTVLLIGIWCFRSFSDAGIRHCIFLHLSGFPVKGTQEGARFMRWVGMCLAMGYWHCRHQLNSWGSRGVRQQEVGLATVTKCLWSTEVCHCSKKETTVKCIIHMFVKYQEIKEKEKKIHYLTLNVFFLNFIGKKVLAIMWWYFFQIFCCEKLKNIWISYWLMHSPLDGYDGVYGSMCARRTSTHLHNAYWYATWQLPLQLLSNYNSGGLVAKIIYPVSRSTDVHFYPMNPLPYFLKVNYIFLKSWTNIYQSMNRNFSKLL